MFFRVQIRKKRKTEAKHFTSYGLLGRLLFVQNRVTGISYVMDSFSQFSVISSTAADKLKNQ